MLQCIWREPKLESGDEILKLESDDEIHKLESADEIHKEEENVQEALTPQVSFFGSICQSVGSAWQSVTGIASADFDDWFLQKFGTPKPEFCQNQFGDMVSQAQADQRLIVLFFYCTDDLATQQFCRDFFQNSIVLGILARSFILWGGDVSRSEPERLAMTLGVNIFPGLCVLEPLRNGFDHVRFLEWPNGTFTLPSFRLGPRQQGMPLNTEECIAALSGAARDHQNIIAQREMRQLRESERLEADRQIRAQQDREYEESLLADQCRYVEEQAKEVIDAPPSGNKLVETQEPKATTRMSMGSPETFTAEDESQWQLRKEQILAEPEPAAAGVATTTIKLKLPCGRFMQRIFGSDKTSLADLLEWADYCRPERNPARFELCTTFPIKVLDDKSASLRNLGLAPSAVLILRASN